MTSIITVLRAAVPAALLVLAPFAASAQSGSAPQVVTEHSRATLMLSKSVATPGETLWAALKLELDPGWHTYWRNSGDSGLAGSITWTLPEGVSAGEIAWPTPERVPYGPLMNFGYSDKVILPVPLTVAPGATAPRTLSLEAKAMWLVCADICIPDEGGFAITLNVDAAGTASIDAAEIEGALAALPQPAPWPVALSKANGTVVVTAGPGVAIADSSTVTYFPYDGGLIDNAAPQTVEKNADRLTVSVAEAPLPLDLPAQTGGLLVMSPEQPEASPIAYSFTAAAPAMADATPLAAPQTEPAGLVLAIAFAFLGGLILNLMPCVLPVLAMKALSLVGQGDNAAAQRRRDGLLYTLGVMVTFGALAVGLLALRAAGAEIGWGFQLQSPAFVLVLVYVLMALGFSLSGVFTIGGGIMGAGQGLTQRGGGAGAFFTGALAVVVATPCTAPFMGVAMGFAMTQPPLDMFVVFQGLALGLAAPFLALSFAPRLAALLPKPGAWMDRFKQVLAFPMYASAAWLVWVLSQQLGPEGFAAAMAGVVLIGMAAWTWGLIQDAAQATARRPRLGIVTGLAALIAAAGLVGAVADAPGIGARATASEDAGIEPYSAARLETLRGEGKAVFVNFTAAWCITCLMNERVALNTPEVKAAFAKGDIVYLKADWTNRDPAITAALAAFGRHGVPLYVLYPAGGGAAQVLPQLLTAGSVLAALGPK
ncbi:MAG: protein-disulfide reductase DsbD family protein [Rhodospirillaceae bacterium]|nr:protein-disulfide reductase DsbD family protein [Rhodospirillaceae bacterium]